MPFAFIGWLTGFVLLCLVGIAAVAATLFGVCWMLSTHEADVDFADAYGCERIDIDTVGEGARLAA